ncbi:MAG: redox-sensing transcriptional repressor Rex [Clostridia bacterium]|nr:redox-sensing transcriptional repressor Rex [Clostridia bacterium]
MSEKQVPLVVVKRLPRYHRYLGELLKNNISRVSSTKLSKKMGVTASQIRQDLNFFGGFGQQGYGYNVEMLYDRISSLLGLDKGYKTVIIGAGNLGRALANYGGFKKRGFSLCGIFDTDPNVIGSDVAGLKVMPYADIEKFAEKEHPDIAILTLPKDAVKSVAEQLVSYGIKSFLNFVYVDLQLPDDVIIENVHLSDSIMTLSYKMTNK